MNPVLIFAKTFNQTSVELKRYITEEERTLQVDL